MKGQFLSQIVAFELFQHCLTQDGQDRGNRPLFAGRLENIRDFAISQLTSHEVPRVDLVTAWLIASVLRIPLSIVVTIREGGNQMKRTVEFILIEGDDSSQSQPLPLVAERTFVKFELKNYENWLSVPRQTIQWTSEYMKNCTWKSIELKLWRIRCQDQQILL